MNRVTPGHILKYNKFYIGLSRDGVPDNFVAFIPRKEFIVVRFKIEQSDELTARIEEGGLSLMGYVKQWGLYQVRCTAADLDRESELLDELVVRAGGVTPPQVPES